MSAQKLPHKEEITVEPRDVMGRRLTRALDYAEGFWLGEGDDPAAPQVVTEGRAPIDHVGLLTRLLSEPRIEAN
jgi:hypothetical protein